MVPVISNVTCTSARMQKKGFRALTLLKANRKLQSYLVASPLFKVMEYKYYLILVTRMYKLSLRYRNCQYQLITVCTVCLYKSQNEMNSSCILYFIAARIGALKEQVKEQVVKFLKCHGNLYQAFNLCGTLQTKTGKSLQFLVHETQTLVTYKREVIRDAANFKTHLKFLRFTVSCVACVCFSQNSCKQIFEQLLLLPRYPPVSEYL